MKKSLSIILTIILILSSFTISLANSEDKLYKQSAQILNKVGILQEMRLDENLKRQDMIVLMSRLYKEEDTAKNYKGKHKFEDINDEHYNSYIAWSVNKGLIKGMSKDTFGFNKATKVQEFQAVLLRALDYKEETENWASVPAIAESLNLMKGISAKPNQEISRGIMAAMTINALKHNLKGNSITLAQKLDIDISNPFDITVNTIIEKGNLKLEGNITSTKSLKLCLKPISEDSKEKIFYNIDIQSDGNFVIEIPNLKPGKYEYSFVYENLATPPESFTIPDSIIKKA